MIDYGKQKSTVRPEELELTETKVFVSSNITEVNEDETDGQPGFMDTCNGCFISSCRYYNNQLLQYSFMEYFE
ncbi:hypothetical protein [Mediterraneibacter faecis]|uniref:hypothetical protein n=1 Tax=Mediterraneibacter faecis TaxID=592978 RepID=UPI0032C0F1EE